MNNINELIEIIRQLGGEATYKEILSEYQIRRRVSLTQDNRTAIGRTLSESELVFLDSTDKKWKICTEENKLSQISVLSKRTMSLEEVDKALKEAPELLPEKYDGSYEWMYKAVKEYVDNVGSVTINDMDFIYSLALGTWKIGVEKKKERLMNSNLNQKSKEYLSATIDTIWNKAQSDDNYFCSYKYKHQVGMFGTGFMTFSGKLEDRDARRFIGMLSKIVDLENDNQIYDICSDALNHDFNGLGAASASIILHCLKPFVFPIINGNDNHGTIFDTLGINLRNSKSVNTYIYNCRKIKDFRDSHYPFKNYRIFDLAMWALDDKDFDLYSHLRMIKN